jgi:hypothetical protein
MLCDWSSWCGDTDGDLLRRRPQRVKSLLKALGVIQRGLQEE